MTFLFDDKIRYDDSANLTAFSRLRTAEARLLGEYRYMYTEDSETEMNDHLEGNGTLTADLARNCFLANTTTAAGDRVVRQTKQYHPYISGTSNIGKITFKFNNGKINLLQSVGLFDDDNGFILRINDDVPEFVIRKGGNDEEVVTQSQWNKDRLDGSMNEFNQSGITLDYTKTQILVIDYQWLGVGRVRMGFDIGGNIVICHEFNHANIDEEVYTFNPSLPCRWEIENVGETESPSSLMIICGAVYCEGANYETGFTRSISTDGTLVNVTSVNSTNGYGILAVRLKNSLAGKPTRCLARLKNIAVSSDNDLQFKVVILENSSALSAASWNDVPGYGWCEYAKNFALSPTWNTAGNFKVIDDTFAIGTTNNKSGTATVELSENRTTAIYQNYDSTGSQVIVIIGYRLVADAAVRASMSWLEVK